MPFYNWSELERSVISPHYSTAEGRVLGPRDTVLVPPDIEHEAWAVHGEVEMLSFEDRVAS